MYSLEKLNQLKNEMDINVKIAEESETKYYSYLKEMQNSCNHEWKSFGFDYQCSKCGKLDY